MAMERFKRFIEECVRVLRITKKPTMEEFKAITKVSGLGILLIGAIGFLIFLIKVYLTNLK
ncbi:MAG: protein translocase SEC61 complex subunit gamma [Candidatus Woesearchaeota archaeon]